MCFEKIRQVILKCSVLWLFFLVVSYEAGESGRVVGGQTVDLPNKYPMLVRLSIRNSVCGGTILDKRWVITAAYCVQDEKTEDIAITAGDYDQHATDGTEQVVGAIEVIIHDAALVKPSNDKMPWAFPSNIAIIRVHPPFVFNGNVVPINFPDVGYFVKENSGNAYIAGWGFNSTTNLQFPGPLRDAKVQLLQLDECQDRLEDLMVTESHLCAGYGGIPGECVGDEGGPLLLYANSTDSFTQIALFSHTLGFQPICGWNPSVFMNLEQYLYWIKHQVRRHCQRRNVAWCNNACKKPWQCCDKFPKKSVAVVLGGVKGICYNRTIAKNCMR